mgnify:CR=1 FL=1
MATNDIQDRFSSHFQPGQSAFPLAERAYSDWLRAVGEASATAMSHTAANPFSAFAVWSTMGLGLSARFYGIMLASMSGATAAPWHEKKAASDGEDDADATEVFNAMWADRNAMPEPQIDIGDVAPLAETAQDVAAAPALKVVAAPEHAVAEPAPKAAAPKRSTRAKAAGRVEAAAKAETEDKAPSSVAAAAPVLTVNGAEVVAAPVAAEAVAASQKAEGVATVATEELQPEDFRRPKAMEKPGQPDDLKQISGIGPKMEQVLNGLGIWTFGQIAALKPAEVVWLDDYLGFRGRISRDGWIRQAAQMQAGG